MPNTSSAGFDLGPTSYSAAYHHLRQRAAAPGLDQAELSTLLAETLHQQELLLRDYEQLLSAQQTLAVSQAPQQAAETAQPASQELLRATLDSSLDMVQVLEAVRDEAGAIVDFRWVLNNHAAEQVYGDILGQRLLVRNPGVVEAGIFATFRRVVETGQPDQQEYHYVHEQFNGWFYQSTVKLADGVATTTADLTARKQAEQQVRRLQGDLARRTADQYQALFNALDQGFCLVEVLFDAAGHSADYRFLEVNAAFERQTGLTQAAGRTMRELAPAHEQHWFDRYGQVARTGEPVHFTQQAAALHRWYDVHACRFGPPEAQQVAILFQDVTARKRHEADLAFLAEISQDLAHLTDIDETLNALGEKIAAHLGLSACLYAELFDAAQIAVIEHGWQRADMPNLLRTYRTTEFMNDEIRQLCLSGQPVIIRDVFADPRTDGPQYAMLHIGSFVSIPLVRAGEWHFLLVVYRPDPSDWRAEEIELIRELTARIWTRLEQARAEQALRKSEAWLHTALATAELGTFVWHVAEDRTEEDARARRHFGLAPDATVSLAEALHTTFHPEDAPRYAAAVGRAVDPTGPGTLREEFRVRHPDGQQRWLLASATTTFAGTPRAAVRLTGVLADITERKQQEQRQQFLLQLSDTLRPLADAAQMQAQATQLLGEHLHVDRAYYVEVHEAAGYARVVQPYGRGDSPSLAGTYALAEYDWTLPLLRRGETLIVHDAATSALIPTADRVVLRAVAIGAHITVPLLQNGQLAGALCVTEAKPHHWTTAEVDLVRETGERVWAAIERARAEQALQASEQRLRALVTNLPGAAVFVVGPDLRYQLAEGEALHAAGLAPADLLGRTVAEALPPAVAAQHQAHYQQALAGQGFSVEHEAHGHVYVSRGVPLPGPTGQAEAVLVVSYDITERKRAEEALRQAEEHHRQQLEQQVAARTRELRESRDLFQSIFDTSLTGLSVQRAVRAADGTLEDFEFTLVNPEQARLAGRPDLVGRHHAQLYPGVHPSGIWEAMQRTLETGQPQQLEYYYPHEGVNRWFVNLFVKLGDGLVATVLDVTARKRAEAENLQLRLQQQQQQVAAVLAGQEEERRRIAESLHNGIGQVLYATKLQLDLLPSRPDEPARQRAAELLADAIRQARAVSHELTPLMLADFGLAAALRTICQQLASPTLRWHCYVDLEDEPALPLALQQAVYRLVQGLAHNVAQHAAATEATLEVTALPDWLVVHLQDNGRGFDPQTVQAGLGLGTLYSRVALLAGTVQVESRPGQGTQVLVRLPMEAAEMSSTGRKRE